MTTLGLAAADGAALAGSLREMPLADVLQLLDLGRRSGVLRVEDAGAARAATLVLIDGRLADASLHALGHAPRWAPPNEPTATHRRRVLDAACDVLAWRSGRFTVAPLAAEPTPAARRTVVAIDAVLLDAAHRADEWARLADRVAGPDAVPSLHLLPGDDALALTADEWRVVAIADGAVDVRGLAVRLDRDVLAVARDVHRLAGIGVLLVATTGPRSSGH